MFQTQQIQQYIYLSIGAILGTWTRIHLLILPQSPIIGNFIGTFLIGIYSNSLLHSPLHLLISTGFCGCLTTYSSWILQTVDYSKQSDQFLFPLFYGICVNYAAFKMGESVHKECTLPQILVDKHKYILIVLSFTVIGTMQDKIIFYQLLLSPIGASIRLILSDHLNFKYWFPFGTYFANILAVVIGSYYNNPIIIVGLCGTISTVSTFVREICLMEDISKSIIYSGVSILSCFYIAYQIKYS